MLPNYCNNRVFLPIQVGTSSSGYGIIGTGTANGAGVGAHPGDSLLIDSNVVTGGGYGITIYGATAAANNRGMRVIDNKIVSANYMGMYILYNYNPMDVINNDITVVGQNYGYYGMYFLSNSHSNPTVGHRIFGNQVKGWSYCGIYATTTMLNSTAARTKMYNNVVQGVVSGYTLSQYGIYFTSPASAISEIYHNTVVMNSSSTSTAASCFYNTGSAEVLIKNNIFYYAGGSGAPLYSATTVTGNKINYNIYYNGANPLTGNAVYNSGAFYNRTNFNTNARGGDSSFFTNPSFLNRLPVPGNLALADGCDGYGVNLSADVPTDINGTPRASLPNIGAYEFAGGVANNLRVVSLLTPAIPVTAGAQDLRFLVKNIGNNTITSYNASYKNGSSTTVTTPRSVSMGVCATDTATFSGANQVTVGPVNHLTMYTDGPNASPDANPSNDTLRTSLFTPLNGTYTVGGTTPDFPTIIDAANGLQFGVSGPVTFDIRPGTYTGQVIVNGPIIGASDSTRVTFEGNNNANRIVTANVAAAAFLINQASFVTVQNLKVVNTMPSGNFAGIGVVGSNSNSNASKVWVRKNVVDLTIQSGTSSSGWGIVYTATAGATSVSAMRGDSSIIDSNIVTGGSYGISHYGASNALYNRGILIRGNKVVKSNYMGTYIAYNYNPIEFLGNEIDVQGQNYGYYGIYYYANQSSSTSIPHKFIGNTVTGYTYYGAYIYNSMSASTTAPLQCYNNILNSQPDGYTLSQYGIYANFPASAVAKFYHNTLVINTGNTSTTSASLYLTGSANVEVKNNIFALYSGAGVPFYTGTAITNNKVNYNNYFHGSTSGNLLYNSGANWNATNYLTNARGGDTSFNYAPVFVGRLPMPGNLRLTSACAQRGFDLTSDVPTDVDNQVRNIPPQLGADENASGAVDMAMDLVRSPSFPIDSGWQDVVVRVRNNGSTTITSMDVSYRMNNGTPVTQGWTGFLAACDTALITFSGIQQLYVPFNVSNTLKVYTSNPNAGADGNNLNDTMIVDVATPLNGNYTIGSVAGDYPSFNAAVNALILRGVSGPVTFNARTATYNENFDIPAITGATGLNTITFKSMANQADSVVILPSNSAAQIVRLAGAKNIIFKYLTFKSTAVASTQNGIVVTGDINKDTITDCKIDMAFQTSYGNYAMYGTGLNSGFDGFVVKNNIITGSYYGLYFYGQGSTYAGRYRNLVIDGNQITNTYAYSIYTYYSSNFTFNKNVINPSALYSGNINYFMYADSNNITNNIWNFANNCTMYLGYYSYNSPTRKGLVANNVITGTGSMASASIYMGYYSQYVDFLHNSVSVPSSSQAVYLYNTSAVSLRFMNNVFHNRGVGSAIYLAAAPTNFESDYNNYFTVGTSLITGNTTQASLAGWRTFSNKDIHSISYNPGFTSFTNLVPDASSPNAWSLNGRAMYDSSVATDINGNPRVANMANGVSDVGAYEFTPTSTPPLATAVPATPVAGGTQVFLFGGDTVARVVYDAFSTAPTSLAMRVYSGVTPPLITPATAYPYFYVSAEAPAGTYTYDLKIKYKPIWLGTLPTIADLKLASYTSTSGWLVLGGSNSLLDSTTFALSSAFPMNDLPAIFTAADNLNPLPVEMIKFAGSKVDVAAALNWATATEKNSSHFEVERSYDAKNFKGIGKVASNGNSASVKNYAFTDEQAFVNNEAVAYYRLKMVDRDGSFEYSNTISINNNEEEVIVADVKVFPNPFNNDLFIDYKAASNETVELRDMSGRVIFTQTLNSADMVHQLNIPASLDKGIYLLTFSNNNAKSVKVVRN